MLLHICHNFHFPEQCKLICAHNIICACIYDRVKTNIVGRLGFFVLNAAILSSFGWNAITVVLRWFLFVKLVKPPGYSNYVGKMELLLLSKVVSDGLLIHPSVSPQCFVILPSFYLDGLLIQLLVDLALEWSSVVCSSNEGIGSR